MVLNDKIDFERNNKDLRYAEKWLPSIPLKKGKYSDTGYRFRRNVFDHIDEWYPGSQSNTHEFFDVTNYNSDTIEIDEFNEDFYGIAEMYFRLETDEI